MGKLIYVIGASGSGKDSIMNFAKKELDGSQSVFFAHRYITRPPDAKTENHISLTHNEFKGRVKLGLFAMHWESHDNFYGIGKEINYWMFKGGTVVVNGSREYLPHAMAKFNKLQPVLIETNPIILLQRLKERGRENDAEILERIERNNQLSVDCENLIVIRNDGPMADAGMQFLEIITKVKNQIYFY